MSEEKKPAAKEQNIKVKDEMKAEEKSENQEKGTVKPGQAVKKKTKVVKKDVAVANGYSLRISPKYSVYICRFIRGRSPESAIKVLEEVIKRKRPLPTAGLEVGHKKGKGIAGGKFPVNACKEIIEIVKQARANAAVNGIENSIITIARSNRAPAPYRSGGRKAKRTHIHIELRERLPDEVLKAGGKS